MIVHPAHITLLLGGYNGYAVFGTGQGRNQKFGLIDRNGEIIIHPEFPGFSISPGSRYVEFFTTRSYMRPRYFDLTTGRWINHDDKHLLWPIDGSAGRYFRIFTRRRSGIIDHMGRQILPMKYGYVGWCGGNFIVQNPRSGLFGIVTPDGEEVVPFSRKYERVLPGALDEPTLVEEDGKWFYIDHCGEPIVSRGTLELPADNVKVLNYAQHIEYGIKEGEVWKYGILDKSGHKVVPPIYDVIYNINKKYVLAGFCVQDARPMEGLIDFSGNPVIPVGSRNEVFSPISGDDDLIVTHLENQQYYNTADSGIVRIGADGSLTEIIPAIFCIPYLEHTDLIIASPWRSVRGYRDHNGFGIFSLGGELLVPFEYNDINYMNDKERIAVNKDDRWFFINSKNERTLF